MLWCLFNKNGQLIYQINSDTLPAAGTTNYQIFAVFQDLSLFNYNSASIKLYKPDLQNHSYYPLMMTKKLNETYNGPENPYFNSETPYSGFIFDFSQYDGENDAVSLLDTTGTWRAVITLINTNDSSIRTVVGNVSFFVGSGVESINNTMISLDALLTSLYGQIGSKLDIWGDVPPTYIKAISTEDITTFDFTTNWVIGDTIFNKFDNTFYKLDEDKVPQRIFTSAEYETKLNKVQVINSSSTNEQYPSARAVWNLVENNEKEHYISVDITVYPTLEDFLETTGKEGNVYLYPVNTSESPEFQSGFYRYIWENNAWLSLGTTEIDLSNYYQKSASLIPTSNGAYSIGDISHYFFGLYTQSVYFNHNVSAMALGNPNKLIFSVDNVNSLTIENGVVKTAILQPYSNGTYDLGNASYKWKDIYLSGNAYANAIKAESQFTIGIDGTNLFYFSSVSFLPLQSGTISLGRSDLKWNNIYLSGNISDGSNSISVANIENSQNKVVSISNASTDTQYPSAKCVWDNLQNIRGIAEGKCKSLVLSYSKTAPTSDAQAQELYKDDGTTHFTSLQDFNDYVSFEEQAGILINSNFNSSSENVMMESEGRSYLIDISGIVYKSENNYNGLKTGDIIIVVEANVPDRWWYLEMDRAYILETKTDLTGYVTLSTAQTISGQKTFSNGTTTFGSVLPLAIKSTSAGITFNAMNGSTSNPVVYFDANSSLTDVKSITLMHDTLPYGSGSVSLGNSANKWKDLYLSGNINLGSITVSYDSGLKVGGNVLPNGSNYYDLGTSTNKWVNLFLTGELRDGTYSFTVASAYKTLFGHYATYTTAQDLDYEEITVCNLSANGAFDFRTPPTGCHPEYKAVITNTSSGAISLTFIDVTTFITNDDNVLISYVNGSAVLSLPSGTTIEVSIQADRGIAVNFDNQ